MSEQAARPLVKICGLTNAGDACLAAEAGADLLGFVFYPASKRAVEPAAVRAIAAALGRPRPLLVGVFVDAEPAAVAAIMADCGLDLAQLGGREPAGWLHDPASPLFGRSYKALQPRSYAHGQRLAAHYRPAQAPPGRPQLLLDAYHPSRPGGTGRTADWDVAARLAQSAPGLMLAGGLTPANVAAALRQVRPLGVDVSSGVEAAPGRKDAAKVRAFIAAAKSAPIANRPHPE